MYTSQGLFLKFRKVTSSLKTQFLFPPFGLCMTEMGGCGPCAGHLPSTHESLCVGLPICSHTWNPCENPPLLAHSIDQDFGGIIVVNKDIYGSWCMYKSKGHSCIWCHPFLQLPNYFLLFSFALCLRVCLCVSMWTHPFGFSSPMVDCNPTLILGGQCHYMGLDFYFLLLTFCFEKWLMGLWRFCCGIGLSRKVGCKWFSK